MQTNLVQNMVGWNILKSSNWQSGLFQTNAYVQIDYLWEHNTGQYRDVRILIIDSQIYHLSKPDMHVNDSSLIEYKLNKIHSAN